jgi:hypothetical protein
MKVVRIMITLRKMIESGQRGGFAQKLLTFYDNLTLSTFMEAYSVADRENRQALQKIFPAEYLHSVWCDANEEDRKHLEYLFNLNDFKPNQTMIEMHFSGLSRLDETGDHRIPIR